MVEKILATKNFEFYSNGPISENLDPFYVTIKKILVLA